MFSEVREYQYGDDIRDIDWNVTARHNKPYIKVYQEERELTVMLLIDMSGSGAFGAVGSQKRDIIAEIAATLAFSAIQTTTNRRHILHGSHRKVHPTGKRQKQILLIIRELIDFCPKHNKPT